MAYTNVSKSTAHFNTKPYTGNNSSNAITGVGFKPDFTWIKNRSSANSHMLFDVVRGATYRLSADTNEASAQYSNSLTSFDSDGFTLNNFGDVNANSDNFASYNWKTQGTAGSSNTDGSINTTTTSVNTTSGFSISKFTATGSAATIGHGLGVAPKWIWVKRIDSTGAYQVYHGDAGATKYYELNENQAEGTATNRWNDTAPTSSVFSIGNEWGNGQVLEAWCWAEKPGFSKFGSFKGTGNISDACFAYCGFKPAFIIIKKKATAAWIMMDNQRPTVSGSKYDSNPHNYIFEANTSNAEATSSNYNVDFKATGFKIKTTNGAFNTNGSEYIFMAFAAEPLVGSNNVPSTAG